MNPGSTSLLLPLVVAWPLLAAAIAGVLAMTGCSRRAFDVFVTIAAGLTLAGVVALIGPVLAESRLVGALPLLTGRIEFVADPIGLTFALAAALVWFCATLYATAWLREDPATVRFQLVSLVLLSANLGVVLAGDLLTLYLCFEVLGLGALLLIVHDGTEGARRAGVKYFWMTVCGGISLLAGILLFHALTGSFEIAAGGRPGSGSPLMWWAFTLMLIGFGVKAGMMPLHVWLPDAHPVAPPPASALLSGVMIKVGAYGIFRVLNIASGGETLSGDAFEPWTIAADMGQVVIWLGLITMLFGVILALGQQQAKRLLAWSSVSQMGFILTGLGTGVYLGGEGAMASAGGLLHVVNHGLFKGALFLGAGAVVLRTGTADMNRLGGLWRKMPVTFGCMLIAAAGISGIPLFNGFVSKCMIHHGLVAAGEQGGGMLLAAEWIFLLTCAGTFACFVKFIGLVFLQKPGTKWDDSVRDPPPAMLAAMIAMVLLILVIGVRPQWLLEGLIAPGLSVLTIPVDPVGHFLSHYLFSAADFCSFAGMTITAIALSIAGMRFGLFGLHAPDRLGVDYWYRAGGRGLLRLCHGLGEFSSRRRIGIQRRSAEALKWLISLLERHEKPAATDRDRDFKRLDALRDRVRTEAEELARSQPDDLSRHDRERLVNDVHWISGLLCTNMIEQAMAWFTGADSRQAVNDWFSAAEDQTEALARSALQLAVAWRDSAEITDDELQTSLRKVLPPLPGSSETDRHARQRRWRDELRALIFRPAHHHWPVTESLDRGRLAARIRRYLYGAAGNLSLALGLLFALLALMLLRL
tara:strand:- start:555 stop:2984 length:2430 start_codon:yes stop_codon:yes gene_type:complete